MQDKFYTGILGWAALQSGLSFEEIKNTASNSAPKLFSCEGLGINEGWVGDLITLDNLVSDHSLNIRETLEDMYIALNALNLWALKIDFRNQKSINEEFYALGSRIGGINSSLNDKYKADLNEKRIQALLIQMVKLGGSDLTKNKLFLNKLNRCYLLGLDVENLKKKYGINN